MLKASRLPRKKDSGGAGTETSTVPFPYQKAKGGSLPRIWVAPRSVFRRSRPNPGTRASTFFREKSRPKSFMRSFASPLEILSTG